MRTYDHQFRSASVFSPLIFNVSMSVCTLSILYLFLSHQRHRRRHDPGINQPLRVTYRRALWRRGDTINALQTGQKLRNATGGLIVDAGIERAADKLAAVNQEDAAFDRAARGVHVPRRDNCWPEPRWKGGVNLQERRHWKSSLVMWLKMYWIYYRPDTRRESHREKEPVEFG